MKVKKFVGTTISEAVEKMRLEFGSEGVVLHTKSIRYGGFLGLFSKRRVEIVGAIDPQDEKPPRQEAKGKNKEKVIQQYQAKKSAKVTWSSAATEVFRALISQEITEAVARKLVDTAIRRLEPEEQDDYRAIRDAVKSCIAEDVPVAREWSFNKRPKVAAFVGPTGVGKTTTIAKLAATYALVKGRSVGLITIDTYRIAAVEQLTTYADIMGVPIRVAYGGQDLQTAIEEMQQYDLILVDTAGRSYKNQAQMNELQQHLKGADLEIHLVVSATTRSRDLQEILRAFGFSGFEKLVITKLDEASCYGVILQAAKASKAPISFLANGQSVPEDIEIADAMRIADLVLGD